MSATEDSTLPARMGITSSNSRRVTIMVAGVALALVALMASIAVGTPGIMFAIVGAGLFAIGQSMADTQTLAKRERERRVSDLAQLAQPCRFSQATIDAFWKRKADLQLTDEEVAPSVAFIEGAEAIMDIETKRAANNGQFPALPDHDRIVGPDECVFATRAIYDKRGDNDESGRFYLTRTGFLFVGLGSVECKWAKIVGASNEGFRLLLTRRDRSTPTVFVFSSMADAMVASHIAESLMA